MVKRLLFWFLWLFFVGVLHLFGNNIGTFVILISSVIIPVLSGVFLLLASVGSAYQLGFEMQDTGTKNEELTGYLIIESKNMLPVFNTSCLLSCENTYTGEGTWQELAFSSKRKKQIKIPLILQAVYCGCLQISAESITMTDLTGLFRKRIKCEARHMVMVLPDGFEMVVRLAENVNALADNDEYSMTRPGSDINEIYAIREYVPGDPIRSIHWKLTEKMDKVMVREFGLPVAKQVLLLFETTIPPDVKIPAVGWDAIAEVFYSTSLALLHEGVYPIVRQYGELRTAEDAALAIGKLFATTDQNNGASVTGAFDHVIIITPFFIPEISGSHVTVLRYGDAFVEEEYINQLSYLELGL